MAGSFGVGIIGTGTHFSVSGSETEGGTGNDGEVSTADEDENFFYGSLFAEYSFGETHGITLGVSYTPMETSLQTRSRTDVQTTSESNDGNITSDDSGTYTANARVSDHATIYLEPTLMYDNFGVYLKGGLARVTVTSLESIALGEDSSSYGNETVNGYLFGAGITNRFDNGMFYKFEVVRTMYDTIRLKSSSGNKNLITADPDQVAGRLAIGWRF